MTPYLYLLLKYREGMRHNKIMSLNKHPVYVFPNNLGNGPIKDPRKALMKITQEANLGFKITPHDLRRTFATATKEVGLSNEDTAVLLNHAKADVTENYIVRSLDYKRSNLEKVQQYLDSYSGLGLGQIAVRWYNGNPRMTADPIRMDEIVDKEIDFQQYINN